MRAALIAVSVVLLCGGCRNLDRDFETCVADGRCGAPAVSDAGQQDAGVDAGAVDAGDPNFDCEGGLPEVSGVRFFRHYTDGVGQVDRPDDLTAAVDGGAFYALVSEKDGGWTRYAPEEIDAGTFRIPGLACGDYYVFAGGRMVVTSSRRLDLSEFLLGRPDRELATAGTFVTLYDVTGLSPWVEPTDDIQFVSAGAGLTYFSVRQWNDYLPDGGESDLPPVGSTTITQTATNLFGFAGAPVPLIRESSGDQVFIFQLVTETTDAGLPYSVAKKIFSKLPGAPPFNVDAGVETRLTGTMKDVAPSQLRTLIATVPRAELNQLATNVSPFNLKVSYQLLGVDAVPTTPELGKPAGAPDIFTATFAAKEPDGGEADVSYDVRFGNPFPSNWTPFTILYTEYQKTYPAPDGGTFLVTIDDRTEMELPASGDAGRLTHLVHSPVDVKVNGAFTTLDVTPVSAQALISWTAPTSGLTPDVYRVQARRFGAGGNSYPLYTTKTSVRLPPGFLNPNGPNMVRVSANHFGTNAQLRPFFGMLPVSGASTLTELVTPLGP